MMVVLLALLGAVAVVVSDALSFRSPAAFATRTLPSSSSPRFGVGVRDRPFLCPLPLPPLVLRASASEPSDEKAEDDDEETLTLTEGISSSIDMDEKGEEDEKEEEEKEEEEEEVLLMVEEDTYAARNERTLSDFRRQNNRSNRPKRYLQNDNIDVVMKFGGSSIADMSRIDHVCHLIQDQIKDGYRPRAVVCSAMGRTTNTLCDVPY